MDIISNKSYENEFYNLQNYRNKPIKGILIYEDAQKKLDISENGKLYRQKWYNYIPFIGTFSASVYANFVLAKTKCLRRRDMLLFKNINKSVNIFAFLIWPLLFFMLWTLFTYLSIDFAQAGSISTILDGKLPLSSFAVHVGTQGDYYNLWHHALIDQLSNKPINNAQDFFNCFSITFSGLFYILVFPLISSSGYQIGNAFVNTNLIFIACFVVITIINPVNIFNTALINSSKLRFVIVYEASSIYRYRAR